MSTCTSPNKEFQSRLHRTSKKEGRLEIRKLLILSHAQSMDTDNSGTITADELREAMSKQGSPLVQEELQRLLESIDVDATGR